MKQIEALVMYDERILQCWQDGKGSGVWVLLADNMRHMMTIHNYLNGKNAIYGEFKEYLQNEGAWLSIALAPNLELAIQQLEDKIENFQKDFEWYNDVYAAYEWLSETPELNNNEFETFKSNHRRTGVVQPENGIYMLQQSSKGYKRITVDVRTLQVVNEEFLPNAPSGWTNIDIKSLLEEGTRFLRASE